MIVFCQDMTINKTQRSCLGVKSGAALTNWFFRINSESTKRIRVLPLKGVANLLPGWLVKAWRKGGSIHSRPERLEQTRPWRKGWRLRGVSLLGGHIHHRKPAGPAQQQVAQRPITTRPSGNPWWEGTCVIKFGGSSGPTVGKAITVVAEVGSGVDVSQCSFPLADVRSAFPASATSTSFYLPQAWSPNLLSWVPVTPHLLPGEPKWQVSKHDFHSQS